jgi:putative (di)nucleoside polyphosphate hydrolase
MPSDTNKLPLRPNVCILLVNKQGLLFLGERFSEQGNWQFPQGGVEPDGSIEDNVLREIGEELGIKKDKLRIEKQLNATNQYDWDNPPDYAQGKWRGQVQSFWVVTFLGNDNEIDLATPHPEFSAFRWCTVEQIKQLAEPKRVPGYQKALDEFQKWQGTK